MKPFSLLHLLLFTVGILILGFLAMPAFAQDAEKMRELQRVIDAQQKQMEAQQKQLDAQKKLLQDLQKQMESLVKDADKEGVTVAAEKPAEKPPEVPSKPLPEIGGALSQDFKHDRVDPTGANVTEGTSKLKIEVPGTNTTIGVHGFAEFQIIHDTDGLNNNEFDTAGIPVDGAPSQTLFSVNPTRLAVSSQTRTPAGRLNTMFSMDFNGELDRPDPRLRVAYGEWINDESDYALLQGKPSGRCLTSGPCLRLSISPGPPATSPGASHWRALRNCLDARLQRRSPSKHPKMSPISMLIH